MPPFLRRCKFPLLLSLALILFQLGLFAFIQYQAGPNRVWLGDYIWNSSDQAVYYSFIEQAKQGAIWFHSFYTPREAPGFLHPFYVPVGWVAAVFDLTHIQAHELAKALVTIIAVFLTWSVARGTCKDERDANVATIVMLAGGGLGWILVVKQAMTGFFPDNFFIPDISTETFFFPTTMGGAHIPLSISLLTYSLYRLYQDLSNQERRWRPSPQGLGAVTTLLFLHPYFAPTLGIAGLLIVIKERLSMRDLLRPSFVYACFALLALSPHVYTYFANPYRRFLLDGNVLKIPSLIQHLFAFMPWLALIIWRVRRHPFTEKERWILVWIGSVLLTLILPFNFKRKLLQGFGLALILLAIPVWTRVLAWAKRTGRIAYAGVWAIVFLSPFAILQSQLTWVTQPLGNGDEFFVSRETESMWAWIRTHTNEQDLILTDTPWLGLWVVPNTERHVWIAHDFETPDYKTRRQLLKELFQSENPERVRKILNDTRATVLVTSSEKNGIFIKAMVGNDWKQVKTLGQIIIWEQ